MQTYWTENEKMSHYVCTVLLLLKDVASVRATVEEREDADAPNIQATEPLHFVPSLLIVTSLT